MRTTMLRAVAVLVIIIIALLGAEPSHATCVAADVIVHRTNQADQPVVTDGQCLVPTGFGAHLRVWQDAYVGSTVTGVPSGVWLEVWLPLP